MGTLKDFIHSKGILPDAIVAASQKLEASRLQDRKLLQQRSTKRRGKETTSKPYAELGIAKPRSGRGLSAAAVASALNEQALTVRQRGKMLKAINALLEKKKEAAVDMKTLFGDTPKKEGKKPKAAKK
jgi:acyl-CoA reductase-like NAD-dependent aldehyde dehydrogenase